jgi:hypothetical protein
MAITDPRAQQLYDEGAAALSATWDDAVSMNRYASHPEVHSPRETLAYAQILLRASDLDRAARAIRAVLALQERRAGHAHEGNFRWFLEDREINDLNGVEFMLDALNAIVREPHLPQELAAEIRDAIALGLDEIDRLDVHLGYTNIALSDICNSVLGGEAIADEDYVARGEQRLDDWLELTSATGAPHEYNSPTYIGVDLLRMAALAQETQSPEIALKARLAEELLWLHVAGHYHPMLAQIAGPHARAYFDGWSGAGGYLKLILWRLLGDDHLRPSTPYAARTREEAHIGIATTTLHCPAYIERILRDRTYPFAARELADARSGLILSTHMTESYALGAATRAPTVGDPPEPWGQHNSILLHFRRDAAPGYGTLFARYAPDDRTLHAAPRRAGDPPSSVPEDWWDEGIFVAAQDGPRAIIAAGLRARLRPTSSYRLSINMLGAANAEVRIGGRPLDAAQPFATVVAGEAVCIAAGDVYVALIPLEATDMGATDDPIRLQLDGEHLALDVYNYRGPAKAWWEYRSLSGPFYKGNVRNAVIIEVAERGEYPGIEAFADHVAAAMVADSLDDAYVREIAYTSEGGAITLRYSLWDMTPAAPPPVAPRARSGAVDGSGPQSWLSRDTLMQLGRVKLLAGGAPKWLVADDDRRHYVVFRPTSDESPLWLETPDTIVECDTIGLSRIVLDESASLVEIEAAGDIAPIRLRTTLPTDLRLTINGADVTPSLTTIDDDTREFAGL